MATSSEAFGSAQATAGIAPSVLRVVPLFRDFGDDSLAELALQFAVQRFRKHEMIIREGEPGEKFYVVLSGSVAVVREAGEGRESILSILTANDFFGEMSIFDTSVRSASIRTLTATEVAVIDRGDFLALIDRSPRIGRLLVIALAERLRAANALIAANTSQDIRSRLAALLVNLMDQFGEPAQTGTRITLRLTNQEMANMIGTTRETVNRSLNRLWDERLIDMRAANIIVLDEEKLRALLA
jgi:CRP/FNR family cyclic AMP-dependent transcriptional regulator